MRPPFLDNDFQEYAFRRIRSGGVEGISKPEAFTENLYPLSVDQAEKNQ
jgi:hypothetical protein